MFGFKTEEEKEILADYNNVVRDMKELKDLVDQMSATIATQAQMIDTPIYLAAAVLLGKCFPLISTGLTLKPAFLFRFL